MFTIAHNKQADRLLDCSLYLQLTYSRYSQQVKVDNFKEDIVGGNIVISHHLYSFLSQIMK